jgi:hypothetical protein
VSEFSTEFYRGAVVNSPAAAPVPTVTPAPPARAPLSTPVSGTVRRGPRRTRLALARLDPWSVMKTALIFSVCLLVVLVVAVAVLYAVLSSIGVFSSLEQTLHTAFNIKVRISPLEVIGGSAVLGVVNVVLFTALATIVAFVYNVAADLVGGIHVTLTESD